MEPLRLTRRQSREVDRIAVDLYGIPSVVLMENAARSAVDALADVLERPRFVGVVCGPGNNGGDGMAVARHLFNRGHDVQVFLAFEPSSLRGDAVIQIGILRHMGIRLTGAEVLMQWFNDGTSSFDMVVDAIFGTGLSRPPGGHIGDLIEAMAAGRSPFGCPIVSLDIPSGLDCDSGLPLGRCVRATRTITFGTQKRGFGVPKAATFLGEIIVGDLGVPQAVFEQAAALRD